MVTKLKGVLKGVLPLWEIKKYINKKSLWHEARKQKNAEVEFTLPDREFFPGNPAIRQQKEEDGNVIFQD